MSLVMASVSGIADATAGQHTLVVPTQYASIQAAVDAAAPGDHIRVRPGIYTEELVITKDVDVRGSGSRRTIVRAPATLTPYGVHLPDGRDLTAIVRVGEGAQVRMSGLTVTGPIPCGVEASGINVLEAATLDLSYARVTNVRTDAATCTADNAAGRAVVYGIPPHIIADGVQGSPAYGRIDHVLIDRYQHAGVSIAGPADGAVTNVSVVGNVVIGGNQLPSFQYGVHVAGRAVAHVAGNVVTGNVCRAAFCGPDPINQAQGAGIIVQSAIAGTTVTGNVFAGNDVGAYQVDSPNCCLLARNTLVRNRYFGVLIQDGDGATAHNQIIGGQVGIGVAADFVDTVGVLRGDRIVGTTVAAVREIDCCDVTATAIITPF